MKLTQVKGNTYVLEGWELIPLYVLPGGKCILLDTGLLSERREIERALTEARLLPAGILGSHIHTDHSPNHRCFREKYGIPVALPAGEAGLCATLLDLKSYFFMLSPKTAAEEVPDMVCPADVLIGPEDGEFVFLGETFGIVHTPGHSPDHISIVTPDDVCYVGDALLSGDDLKAKLPYSCSQEADLASKEKLRALSCAKYVLAHRGVFDDVSTLIDENRALILDRAGQVLAAVTEPMTMDGIIAAVCRAFSLHAGQPRRAALYERNVRSFVEYLLDRGDLTLSVRDGVRLYSPSGKAQ